MTLSPSPLVGSGRRPSAGPGRQFGPPLSATHPFSSLVVIGLAATLMVGPALIAVLAVIFAGRLDAPRVQPVLPVQLMPILEFGRVLLTLVLAAKVIRTTELE
jgi:hypothetical protein